MVKRSAIDWGIGRLGDWGIGGFGDLGILRFEDSDFRKLLVKVI
jgi:hypothetical protein